MSIYVSLASMYDPELFYTLEDIFNNSDNPELISVGLVFTISEEYKQKTTKLIDDVKNKFKNNKLNIKILEGKENFKIGIGRNEAASMYNDEDYFLQIDSHTLLESGWDTQLVNLYNEALEETKNEKTILTSYLGHYWHTSKHGRFAGNRRTKYPIQIEGNRRIGYFENQQEKAFITCMPAFQDFSPSYITNKKFIPAIKFNAQFVFGNKNFAKNINLPITTIFWEEEIFQSITLFYDGFSFVFPNIDLKLMHFYHNNYIQNSLEMREMSSTDDIQVMRSMDDSYLDFLNSPVNLQKILLWEKYSFSSVYPRDFSIPYIPNSYRLNI
jgi:hypothetical protein